MKKPPSRISFAEVYVSQGIFDFYIYTHIIEINLPCLENSYFLKQELSLSHRQETNLQKVPSRNNNLQCCKKLRSKWSEIEIRLRRSEIEICSNSCKFEILNGAKLLSEIFVYFKLIKGFFKRHYSMVLTYIFIFFYTFLNNSQRKHRKLLDKTFKRR